MKRRCTQPGCTTMLSRYNETDWCAVHPSIRLATLDHAGRLALAALAPSLTAQLAEHPRPPQGPRAWRGPVA